MRSTAEPTRMIAAVRNQKPGEAVLIDEDTKRIHWSGLDGRIVKRGAVGPQLRG